MQPAKYDLLIPQRATFRLPMQLQADDTPLDATGYSLEAEIWEDHRRTVKIIELTVNWTNQANGEFDLYLAHTDTATLTTGGFWDMLVITPNGDRSYWLEGRVYLDRGLSDT